MSETRERELVETVARAIYESMFVDDWAGGSGAEAEQFRQCARAAIEALSASTQVDAMREALEPFALLYGEDDDDFPDDAPVTVQFGRSKDYSLTLVDIRRAVAALASLPPGGE